MSQIFQIHASKDNIQSYFFYLGVIAMNPFLHSLCISRHKKWQEPFFCFVTWNVRIFTLYRWIWFCVETHQKMAICSINQLWNSTQLTSFSYISVSFARLMISWRLQNVFFGFIQSPSWEICLHFLSKIVCSVGVGHEWNT